MPSVARKNSSPLLFLLTVVLAACSPWGFPTTTCASGTQVGPTQTLSATTKGRTPPPPSSSPKPAGSTTVLPALTEVGTTAPFDLSPPSLIAVALSRGVYPPNQGKPYAEYSILVYSPGQDHSVLSLSEGGVSYEHATFSPDGRWMAYEEVVGQKARLRLVSTAWRTDQPLTDWFDASLTVLKGLKGLSWSPDGNWLVFEHSNWSRDFQDVYAVNVDTGAMAKIGSNTTAYAWSSEEPYRVAFASKENSSSIMYLASLDGTGKMQVEEFLRLDGGERVVSLAWRPADATLAFSTCQGAAACEVSRLWIVELSSRNPSYVGYHPHPCRRLIWSQNGRLLACCGDEGSTIFDIQQAKTTRDMPGLFCREWFDSEILVCLRESVPGAFQGYAIVAHSMTSDTEETLWSTEDAGLAEDVDFAFGVNDLSWLFDSHP